MIKVSFNVVLKDWDNKETLRPVYEVKEGKYVETGKELLTLGKMVREALNHTGKDEKPTPEDAIKRGMLIVKVTEQMRKPLQTCISATERDTIKERLSQQLKDLTISSFYYMQVCNLLENLPLDEKNTKK